MKELKKMDDKQLLMEVQLSESKVSLIKYNLFFFSEINDHNIHLFLSFIKLGKNSQKIFGHAQDELDGDIRNKCVIFPCFDDFCFINDRFSSFLIF